MNCNCCEETIKLKEELQKTKDELVETTSQTNRI